MISKNKQIEEAVEMLKIELKDFQKRTRSIISIIDDILIEEVLKDNLKPEKENFKIPLESHFVISLRIKNKICVRDSIKQLKIKYNNVIPFDKLKEHTGLKEQDFQEAISELTKSGMIFRPKEGYIQKI